MTLFKIGEGKQIGIIKKSIEEAILDGKIENDYDEALAYLETIKIDNINS
jgi:poly(A) polymerase